MFQWTAEITIQVSKFKRTGFEKEMANFNGGESVNAYSFNNLH